MISAALGKTTLYYAWSEEIAWKEAKGRRDLCRAKETMKAEQLQKET